MKISIASGKGGTGKTFLAVNLASLLKERSVRLLDCDVEEPDDALFLKPKIEKTLEAVLPIPKVDETKCIHCSRCSQTCAYKAITDLGRTVLVFPEMCHGCGGCTLACPVGAISEVDHVIGRISIGTGAGVDFIEGKLNLKQVATAHLIRETKKHIDPLALNLIDSPPGTTCPTVAAVSGTDFCLLVTEPTPFGLHDLKLALGMCRELKIPTGIVINRDGIGDGALEDYCRQEGLEIMARIPHRKEWAQIYSRGEVVVEQSPELREILSDLIQKLEKAVEK